MDDLFAAIDYSISSQLFDDPDNWITIINGKINQLDDDGTGQLIGNLKAYYCDLDSAQENGFDPLYMLDTMSQTEPFYEPFFGEDAPDLSKGVCDLLGYDGWSTNLLIIDRIEILPAYRGRGLTARVFQNLDRQFGGNAGIVTLKAFPLQHEFGKSSPDRVEWNQSMGLDHLETDKQKALSKLIKYYEDLGFIYLGGDNIMAKLRDELG